MWSSLVEQIKIEGVYCYKAGIYYQEVSLIGFLRSDVRHMAFHTNQFFST